MTQLYVQLVAAVVGANQLNVMMHKWIGVLIESLQRLLQLVAHKFAYCTKALRENLEHDSMVLNTRDILINE